MISIEHLHTDEPNPSDETHCLETFLSLSLIWICLTKTVMSFGKFGFVIISGTSN